VTVQACSPRWTLTTFRLGAGDHETDVFITLAAEYRCKTPARRASSGVLHPARAPRVNQTRPRWLPTAAVRISPPCKFCRSFVDPAEGFAPLPPEASPSPSWMPARTTRPLIGEASIADPSLSQDTVGTRAAARRRTSGSTPCTSPAPAIFGTCRIKRSIEQARSSETGSSSGAWRKRPRGSRRRATRALRPRARPPSPAAQQRETSDQEASRQAAKVKKIQTMARWP
jgi:hypothetical protein